MELIEEKKKKQYFIPVIILLIGMFFTVVNIGERKLWVDGKPPIKYPYKKESL